MSIHFDPLLNRLEFSDPANSGSLSISTVSDTYAGFPDASDNNGKIAFLTTDDGPNLSGFYISNGTDWVFQDINITAAIKTTDPTVNEDASLGYVVGQTWVNTSNNKIYISTDVSTGAAVWMDFSQYSSGYAHTGAFAGKPLTNNYVWENGNGINYTSQDVSNSLYKVFSLDNSVHLAVDNPYWSIPDVSSLPNVDLFNGYALPTGVSSLLDYTYDFDTEYPGSTGTGFEGSTGRIRLNDLKYGDQLRVRFDFNVIPQIANTTIEPALWYSNRDANDDITFTFPLTTSPIFYGTGSVGKTYLNRVEISAWIISDEDVNALTLPAIKSDNPVIIQPLGIKVTIIR